MLEFLESPFFTAAAIVGAVGAILWICYDFFNDLREPE